MGGDCSQKAHALEGDGNPLPGRCERPASARIKTLSHAPPPSPVQVVVYGFSRWVQYGNRLVKRRRAMLESNPPRNSQRRLIKAMGLGAKPATASPRRFNPKPTSD